MRRLFHFAMGAFAVLLSFVTDAQAHKPSDSYLSVTAAERTLDVRWDIALRDLDYAIGLDADEDGSITWGEVKAALPETIAYAKSSLSIQTAGILCPLEWTANTVDSHTDGTYLVFHGSAECAGETGTSLDVTYNLLFDIDTQHRGLLRLTQDGEQTLAILRPEARTFSAGAAHTQHASGFSHFVVEGVWHIWIGFDHILFLVALLLPAVLYRSGKSLEGVPTLGVATKNVLKVVTAFTVAHSITLAAATLHLVDLPSRLVESVIALSVVIAALNNVHAMFNERRAWIFAFAFGLIHGFGFAGVLGELGVSGSAMAVSLLGFNAGVELGQLAIVAIFLPVAYLLRNSFAYRKVMLAGGSYAIVLLAAIWFTERAFDVVFLG